MALGSDRRWEDEERYYSSGSYSDDSPILSYRYDKSRHPELHDVMEERERRSTFSVITKFSLFCTAVILFCVLMYIPLYTKANYTVHKGLLEGWSIDTNRDTKIYVHPNNVTTIHEPKSVCPQNGNKNKLFLLVVICSATSNFEEREAIRNTWANYENYKVTSKVFNLVREKYKDYNYTHDLYPNGTDEKSDTDKENSSNSNTTKVAIEKSRSKRDISSYKNLLPELASALQSNLKTVKTDVVEEQNHNNQVEEKRFDYDDTVFPSFDMNKELDVKKNEQEIDNNENTLYEDTEESNIMKIPPKDYDEEHDLSKILNLLQRSNFPIGQRGSEAGITEPDFKFVFLLGLPTKDNDENSTETQSRIDEEAAKYGDIIQESFLDTYNNLTIKSIMMLKYVNSRCNGSVRYILKTDDDMYVNMPNLMLDLRNRSEHFDKKNKNHEKKEYLLIGDVICGAKPVTDVTDKWYSPRYMYSGKMYPCYASGVSYVFSAAAAQVLYRAALITPLFHLEDVYITGICALQSTPRLRARDDPLFSYAGSGRRLASPALPGRAACTAHALAALHRVSARAMPTLQQAMADPRKVDMCERKRLTQIARFTGDDENNINKKLPKELLLRILSYLDVVSLCRCAQVSKLWNVLALDGSNWQRIDLFDFQRDVEGSVIENISQRCGGFLRKLSLRGCESIADGSMKTLAQSCPNIEDLNLNKCKKITDQTCQALGKRCSKLQRINLDSCPSITDISLKALADGCHLLTHVNVSWCQSITENGVEAIARNCPKLRSFICRGCKNVNDRAVTSLATHCLQLEVLNVQGCEALTDDSISRLGGAMRSLCLSGCSQLTDATLQALAARCPDLVTLELAMCSHLTDAGFQALARSCRLLERMDLEECVLITDATLVHLAMGCPRLEKLTLSHCELITDFGIKQLSMSPCAAEHLTVLGLDNCPLVTDGALEHLTCCHNLQLIELYDCQLVTRNAIRKLRNHLPNIKVHAYFAPVTPPAGAAGARPRYCRCCNII